MGEVVWRVARLGCVDYSLNERERETHLLKVVIMPCPYDTSRPRNPAPSLPRSPKRPLVARCPALSRMPSVPLSWRCSGLFFATQNDTRHLSLHSSALQSDPRLCSL
jgi:hypothetical protein